MLFDFWYLKASLDKNIPWNRLNISKLLVNVGLLVVTALDLIMSFVKKGGDSELPLYGVDIWTPIIKLLTFVSCTILDLFHILQIFPNCS